jgi:hypothetical protein
MRHCPPRVEAGKELIADGLGRASHNSIPTPYLHQVIYYRSYSLYFVGFTTIFRVFGPKNPCQVPKRLNPLPHNHICVAF